MPIKYDVTKDENDMGMAVLVLEEGPYKGTKFSFGKIKFGEEDSDGQVPLSFDYDVHEAVGITSPTPEFEKVIGDILVSLIEDYATAATKENECKE